MGTGWFITRVHAHHPLQHPCRPIRHCCRRNTEAKRKPPRRLTREVSGKTPWTAPIRCRQPLWLSFGTAQRKEELLPPATLNKALSRPCLVYPLASLDVSGQWPVSRADASPNEVFYLHGQYTPRHSHCQEVNLRNYRKRSRSHPFSCDIYPVFI